MSLRIDIAVPNFTSRLTLTYTIFDSTSISAYHFYDVIAASIPSLFSEVEQNLSEFSCGDVTLTARNDDGAWDLFGFTSANLDPTARYPLCHYVSIYQDGALVFQGDVDLKTVTFDRKQRTVSFTVLGPPHRLEQWTAETVRRTIPALSTAGTILSVGSLGGSDYWVQTSNFWLTGTVVANNCLIDKNEIIWTIVSVYGVGVGGTDKLRITNPHRAPGRAYTQPVVVPPPTGSFTIRPMIFATRYDWQSDSGTLSVGSVDGTHQYLQDTGKNLYNVGCWTGYWLEDSAGVFWQITDTIVGAGGFINKYVVLKQGGYPAGPDITPHTWPGTIINAPTYSIRKSNLKRLLESMGPSITILGLTGKTSAQEGDKLTLTSANTGSYTTLMTAFATTAAQTQVVEIQFAGPHTAPPAPDLTDHMLWLMDDLEADLLATDGVVLATPYYRDKTISQLATLLFAAACGGALTSSVNALAFSDNVVHYADFGGKSVADALSMLAVVSNCALFCTFSGAPGAPLVTYCFQRRDLGLGSLYDLSTAMPDGTSKILERQDSMAWEFFYPYIKVGGVNGTQVQRGSPRQGGATLEVTSDFMDTYAWLNQVVDRLWTYFGKRRARTTVKVKGESVVGLQLLGRVRLAAADEWWVVKLSRELREPVESVDLDLINATGVYYTPTDYAEIDASAIPEPPVVTGVTGSGAAPHTVTFSWPFPITQLLGFNRRLWGGSGSLVTGIAARPENPNFFVGVGGLLTIVGGGVFQDAISALDLSIVPGGSPWLIEYEAVLIDGRVSIPSVAYSFT